MTKKEIIKILNKYNFNKAKYVVISGAALVLHGIKESTSDIDISVDEEYYNYLLNNYNCKFERINEYNEKCYMIDNVINFGKSFYPKNIDQVDGISVSSLKDILELKKFLNRDKDKKIIDELEEFILNNSLQNN